MPSEDGNWREDPRTNAAGTSYRQRVRGNTPQLRPEVTGEIAKTEQYPLIIRLTDRNNRRWIMGSPDEPFRFSAQAQTNSVGRYELTFEAEVTRRAAGYEPMV
ncbi:MAG: hypothetical protein AAFY91_05270 [Bacteroidota bacterium]